MDSDTSTSDTLMLFATGKGGKHAAIAKASDKKLTEFRRALDALLLDLALQVVQGRRGRAEADPHRCHRRGKRQGRQAHRPVHRQFAAGQDRGRRQRRQLGPHRDGGGQGRRGGRPRQAEDQLRRPCRGGKGHARRRSTTKQTATKAVSAAARSQIAVDIGIGKGRRGFGPAI